MYGSSKGNQVKVYKDKVWYKGDYLGYEGASECVVSRLLQHSNVVDFVSYDVCRFVYNGNVVNGCCSMDFKLPGEEEITLENLIQKCTGNTSDVYLSGLSASDRIIKVVDFVKGTTGLVNFGEYLTMLLELDRLVLNEDRHFHNIVLLKSKSGTYRCCPVFDNGAALLSDTSVDYPIGMPVLNAIRKVKAKPFLTSFTKQVDICEELYGRQFKLYGDVCVSALTEGLLNVYEKPVIERIEQVLTIQLSRYRDSDVEIRTADDILDEIET